MSLNVFTQFLHSMKERILLPLSLVSLLSDNEMWGNLIRELKRQIFHFKKKKLISTVLDVNKYPLDVLNARMFFMETMHCDNWIIP